jgi:hypothetical protein
VRYLLVRARQRRRALHRRVRPRLPLRVRARPSLRACAAVSRRAAAPRSPWAHFQGPFCRPWGWVGDGGRSGAGAAAR